MLIFGQNMFAYHKYLAQYTLYDFQYLLKSNFLYCFNKSCLPETDRQLPYTLPRPTPDS